MFNGYDIKRMVSEPVWSQMQVCRASVPNTGGISSHWKRLAKATFAGPAANLMAAGTAATAFHLMTTQADLLVDVAEVSL